MFRFLSVLLLLAIVLLVAPAVFACGPGYSSSYSFGPSYVSYDGAVPSFASFADPYDVRTVPVDFTPQFDFRFARPYFGRSFDNRVFFNSRFAHPFAAAFFHPFAAFHPFHNGRGVEFRFRH